MKNAKKSLALLLALVMILGMGTMGASAAFDDAASIDTAYTDAVNVMAGMGILAGSDSNGDGKFEFNPTGNVTRAQAAKMISYMILGKDAAERLPSKAMFTDVKVTDWSAKFVYYLANKKIINGYGNGNFGPNDTVTATQLAKMLLAAVGYGQANEFVGVGWDVNVFALAVELGLYDGTKATDYDAAATREEASLYVFNTMTEIPLMKYVKEDSYYDYKDALKSTFASTKYNYAEATGVITAAKTSGSNYTVLTYVSGVTSVNLNLNIDISSSLIGHKVDVSYNTKVEKDDDGASYCNAYTIEDLSKEVAMFLAPYKTIYNNMGGSKTTMLAYNVGTKTAADSFTYWINNVDNTYVMQDTKTYGDNFTTKNTVAGIKTSAETMPPVTCWVDGSLIIDDTNKIIGFKNTSYTVEEVRKITTTTGAETITLSYSGEIKNSKTEDNVVEYDGIAKGDYVSVTKSGNVYVLQKCTLIEDVKVTSIGSSTDVFKTVNGTYWISSKSKLTGDALKVGGTYDFYMDKNNMYALTKEVEDAVKNLTFVSYLYTAGNNTSTSKLSYYAKCVGTDGTVADYLITKDDFDTIRGSVVIDNGAYKIDKLYTLRTTTDSSYYNKLTVAKLESTGIVTSTQKFASNYRVAEGITTGNYLLAADVEYIFVKTETDKTKTTVSISKTKPTSTSGPYTFYFYADRVSSDSSNYDVNKIFVIGSATAIAGTSYIYSSGSDAYTRRSSSIGHTAVNADNGVDNYLYAFIDKDYVKTIKLLDSAANNANFDSKGYLNGGFYKYTVDAEGYYEIEPYYGTATDDDNVVVNRESVTGIYNNMITTTGGSNGVSDLDAANATIVDFSGFGLTSLEQINDYLKDGYTVKVSLWSYLYDEYKGTSKATTTTIYVNSISK